MPNRDHSTNMTLHFAEDASAELDFWWHLRSTRLLRDIDDPVCYLWYRHFSVVQHWFSILKHATLCKNTIIYLINAITSYLYSRNRIVYDISANDNTPCASRSESTWPITSEQQHCIELPAALLGAVYLYRVGRSCSIKVGHDLSRRIWVLKFIYFSTACYDRKLKKLHAAQSVLERPTLPQIVN
jgi:hypothetical protein